MEIEILEKQETALIHLKWNNEEMQSKVCPIFQKLCKGGKCMSYNSGQVRDNPVDIGDEVMYKKYPPFCANAIVTGTIECQEP